MGAKQIKFNPPDWFSLSKYEGVKDLDLEGWFVQIHRRFSFFKELVDDPIEKKELEDEYRLRLEEVRENPLGNDPRYKPKPAKDAWNDGGVALATPLNLAPLLAILYQDPEGNHPFSPKKISAAHKNGEKWATEPFINPFPEFDCYPFLTCNLELPDEILKEGFASLLLSLRTRKPWKDIKPLDVKVEMQSWCEFAVLPYWDLKTWAEEKKIHITQSKMTECIFLPGEKDLNAIRNTTKKKAEKIFSEKFLAVLGALCVEKLS